MSQPWVTMIGGGIAGGQILTSEGTSVVAEDGRFQVPASDVPSMLARGAKVWLGASGIPTPDSPGRVAIGDYYIVQDTEGNLIVEAPGGVIIPLVMVAR